MEKVAYDTFGDASVLKIEECPIPRLIGKNKILVKVMYSSLNAVDWKYRKGYFGLFTKLFKTSLGFDIVGEIIETSNNLLSYKKGDFVLGLLPTLVGGAHCEYVILSIGQFVLVPKQLDLESIAGLPMAGVTAWMALVEKANIKRGQRVLINGGSSGVGHLAIQLAKKYGAIVTSVSSGKNEEFCKSIGADYTINYQEQKIANLKEKYDIIFDVVSTTSIREVKSILNNEGVFIDTNISLSLLKDMLFHSNVKFVYVHPHVEALTELCGLVKSNLLKVYIDRTFRLSDIANAHRYVEKSRTVGKVIVEFE